MLSGCFFIKISILDTPALAGIGRKKWAHARLRSPVPKQSPRGGAFLCGNAQTPTAFAGNVCLDEDIGRYSLFRKSTLLSELAVAQACGKEDFSQSTGLTR